ncbi:reverse transcriptase (RNA-dependent DNA polymerase) [Gramella sp. Hel_I_59]|uniref:RNA-directed DNA polymerase n=1 Tax=Gramella sp. Hel_I_59 TaxID=1249978 RepID=UPI00115019FC|nr:RNA-directed DNA polymerase [Gramella sp. Hel_I_59]TQI71213.1 reverse transcriptase (RNA-dependent DNA polymerase) [Gramella sp. Hel_I_59]
MNDLTKEEVFEKLLDYGLFPEKIDKIFTSHTFGSWVRENDIKKYQKNEFSNIVFHLTRNNNAPRILNIPHPIAYHRLAKAIRNNWMEISNKIGEVDDYFDRSMIIPKPNNLSKRLVSMLSYDQTNDQKFLTLEKSFEAKYLVHADIANCYPSIYSHAVPWALVGKKEAKGNNDKRLWYNKLDFAIRSTQRNETVGIPIGPDTSSVFSELILSQIDKKLSDYKYFRYIDDFKCYCKSKEEADTFINKLSKELENFNLRLNQKKTEIIELPVPIEEDWIRQLKSYANTFLEEDELKNKHTNYVSEFIDLAIRLAQKDPNDSAIKYAVKILSKKVYNDRDLYILLIMYLSRVCFIYPYFIDVFDEILSKNSLHYDIIELIEKEINSILKEHKEYSRSDVALWGIHLSLKYDFQIEDFENYSKYLIEDRDCLPVLLCYEYSKKNDLKLDKYFALVKELIDEKLEEEWWVYIYSLYFDYPNKPALKTIRTKDVFFEMRKGEVQFIRQNINQKLFNSVFEEEELPF